MHDLKTISLCGFRAFMCLAVFSAVPAYNQEKPRALVFNPGPAAREDCMKGWLEPFHMAYVRDWGRSRGLMVAEDRGPVVDNSAAYVGPRGSTLYLDGLARGGRYRMWIDFVRFRSAKKSPPAVLKIFASIPGGASRHIASVRFDDVGDSYYAVDLPVEITMGGSAEIMFVELSRGPGIWGVWDIIIAHGRDLPQASDIAGENVINYDATERIVQ